MNDDEIEWVGLSQAMKESAKEHAKAMLSNEDNLLFRSLLESKGWIIAPMDADGHCFYRAIAHAFHGDQNLHPLVREDSFHHQVCPSNSEYFASFTNQPKQDGKKQKQERQRKNERKRSVTNKETKKLYRVHCVAVRRYF